MAKVSISKAAKLAGISRTTLYENYIHKGKISLSHNFKGQPEVDTSELLRVFGTLQGDGQTLTEPYSQNEQALQVDQAAILQERVKGLEALLEAREQELTGYREREQRFMHLLEHQPATKKRRWWWWGR